MSDRAVVAVDRGVMLAQDVTPLESARIGDAVTFEHSGVHRYGRVIDIRTTIFRFLCVAVLGWPHMFYVPVGNCSPFPESSP